MTGVQTCALPILSLEIAEEEIIERLDANILNIETQELKMFPKVSYENGIQKIISKSTGKLIVKQYPTGSINMNNVRNFVEDLKTKHNIKLDFLIIDYMNLLNSTRYAGSENSYQLVKHISEEMRGYAVEQNLCI